MLVANISGIYKQQAHRAYNTEENPTELLVPGTLLLLLPMGVACGVAAVVLHIVHQLSKINDLFNDLCKHHYIRELEK